MSRSAWITMLAAVALVGAVAFMRFGGPSATEEPGGTPESGATAATSSPSDAAAAGGLVLKDMHGQDVALASFKGKVVILNFWATWCGPCKVEIPDLLALQADHPDDLAVVGIVVMDPIDEKLPAFVKELKMTYPILDGNDRQDLEAAYGPFIGLPTSVILDKEGAIVTTRTGMATKQMFADAIAPLL
jgi:thiol-disulfide isomerase/thioredoxin